MTATLAPGTVTGGAGGGFTHFAWPKPYSTWTEHESVWTAGSSERVPIYEVHEGGVNEMRTRRLLDWKIDKIMALKDGWRGEGSEAPSDLALGYYLSVYRQLTGRDLRAAEPTPTVDGGIHMEWKRGDYEFSAEVVKDGSLVLNVFAPDMKDDIERVIPKPGTRTLVDFIEQGADRVEC